MRLQRSDKSLLARWWFSVDWQLLAAMLALLAAGIMISLVASPAIALKRGAEAFFFVKRHIGFALIGCCLMFAASLLTPAGVRRWSLIVAGLALPAMALVLRFGPEINGAQRWLVFGGWQIQPSEFVKPALIVLFAWALADQRRHQQMPALWLASGLVLCAMGLLVLQPDVGQTILIGGVCLALCFLAGRSLPELCAILAVAAIALVIAYFSFDHVRTRVDSFRDPKGGDTYQVDKAVASIVQGGWLGRGPGEGTLKTSLPDAHTDYVVAVVAEEYGALACLALLALFGFLVMRATLHVWRQHDPFARLAIAGLALLTSCQALINMGVSAGMFPAKGMTLPFISYGGSSLLGVCLAMGMLLALTRSQPGSSNARSVLFVPAGAAPVN